MKKDDNSEFKFVGYTLLTVTLLVVLIIVLYIRYGNF